MRKAYIKINKVVNSCLECPFCVIKKFGHTEFRIDPETNDPELTGYELREYYACAYHDEDYPIDHYIADYDELDVEDYIPDWCPFLKEVNNE